MTAPVNLRAAEAKDRASIATMLARAFMGDPAFGYIFPDPADRAWRLPLLFAQLFDSDLRGGYVRVTHSHEAATLWRSPGRPSAGWGEMFAHAIPLFRALGPATVRALRLLAAIEAHFPDHPFAYLHIAGCDPAAQGRGLGGAAIRAGLAAVPPGTPCYLETATERNLGLYARYGFVPVEEWRVGADGPRFWSMLRPAGEAAA